MAPRSTSRIGWVLAWIVLLGSTGCYELALRESERDPAAQDGARFPDAATSWDRPSVERPDDPGGERSDGGARIDARSDDLRDGATSPPAPPPPAPPPPAPPPPAPPPSGRPPPAPEPLDDYAECRRTEECRAGSLCLYQRWDCTTEARGQCIRGDFCETWLIPFCACDGTTFIAPGNCVEQPHAHAGRCR
ncbi:MAG: hypothetical protein IT379_06015 [Deltaproteobacteria bacterium]|nr:hypothetical protein [Deltaproteobacteria bacterium]